MNLLLAALIFVPWWAWIALAVVIRAAYVVDRTVIRGAPD